MEKTGENAAAGIMAEKTGKREAAGTAEKTGGKRGSGNSGKDREIARWEEKRPVRDEWQAGDKAGAGR